MSDQKPFHLSVAPDLAAYRPELEHACRFIATTHGLTLTAGDGIALHYGANPPSGAVANPARVFPAGAMIKDDGIYPDRTALRDMFSPNDLVGPLTDDANADTPQTSGSLPYDALGLIFLMISRIEERAPDTLDRHGRFRYVDSVFPLLGGPAVPWADVAARRLARHLREADAAPRNGDYRIVLTHDVDRLRGYHTKSAAVREIAGDLVKRMNPSLAVQTFSRSFLGGEPWSSMSEIMAVSDAKCLRSKFFFVGPSLHPKDSPYAAILPDLLRACTARIRDRGHDVGFHPGYATYDNTESWNAQKRDLENVLGMPLTEGRQHVLRFDIAKTPAIWDCAGMETDYTLCFPEAAGFRSGSCHAVPAYDLVRRQPLTLRFIATAISDFGLLGAEYEARSPGDALEHCATIISQVRKFAGNLCILYHSGNRDSNQRAFYRALVDKL